MTKKTPLPQKTSQNASESLLSEKQYTTIFEPPPSLETRQYKPTILLVDDDQGFLDKMTQNWRQYYTQSLELLTLNPKEKLSASGWVINRLKKNEPLDAVFIDRNIPAGDSSEEILIQLREDEHSRYLPIIIMTSNEFGADLDKQELREHAQWIIYRKGFTPEFLYQLATALPSAQDATMDWLWTDLTRKVAQWIAEATKNNEPTSYVSNRVKAFFDQYMQLDFYTLRKFKAGKDLEICICSESDTKAPECLKPSDLPVLEKLFDEKQGVKIDRLDKGMIGRFNELLNMHFLGTALKHEVRSFGTLTLYRDQNKPVFRTKDIQFLDHLGLQLGSYYGWRRKAKDNSRRLKIINQITTNSANIRTEDDLFIFLGEILHREINGNDDENGKTTVRLLDYAAGKLVRRFHQGMPAQDTEITIDDKNSLYAKALREKTVILKEELAKDNSIFLETCPGINSTLTAPLTYGNQVFGGVNLEHRSSFRYNKDDEAFVRTICSLAAGILLHLRYVWFQREISSLLQSLWHEHSFEASLQAIFKLLYDYTGYAVLLYLTPCEPEGKYERAESNLWCVQRAVDKDHLEESAGELTRSWNQHIKDIWPQSFTRSVLSKKRPEFSYIDGEAIKPYQIDDRIKVAGVTVIPYSMAVIPIEIDGELHSAFTLLFRLDKALTTEQQEILAIFTQILGELLHQINATDQLQQRAKQAEEQAQLGNLYGQMRHILNNQLGGINNHLDLLKLYGDNQAEESVNKIKQTLKKIDANLKAMRFLTKSAQLAQVDLRSVWSKLAEEFTEDSAHPAILETSQLEVSTFTTDPNILLSILYNLVLNAAQAFSASEGKKHCYIELETRVVDKGIDLCIIDNGAGIPLETRRKIFQPDFTTKKDGTGFGLYFCQLMAKKIGGTLQLDSQYTDGCCFILHLPDEQ